MFYLTNIVVKFQVEGLHNWPDVIFKEPKVAFLQHKHRHIFHIKAIAAVSHDDRQIEIILFKRELQDYLHRNFYHTECNMLDFGERSCEMIATDLAEAFNLEYCEVLEDNENGAVVLKK